MGHSNKMYTVLDESEDETDNASAERHDISCEYSLRDGEFKEYGRNTGKERQLECLDKGDQVFFLNVQVPEGFAATEGDGYSLADLSAIFPSNWVANADFKSYNYNPMYLNHYTVEKVGRKEAMVLNQNLNHNWMRKDHLNSHGLDDANHAVGSGGMLTAAKIYKFKMAPADKLTATYATQCSGRGICNSEEGLC